MNKGKKVFVSGIAVLFVALAVVGGAFAFAGASTEGEAVTPPAAPQAIEQPIEQTVEQPMTDGFFDQEWYDNLSPEARERFDAQQAEFDAFAESFFSEEFSWGSAEVWFDGQFELTELENGWQGEFVVEDDEFVSFITVDDIVG